jgi:hypothetical protein
VNSAAHHSLFIEKWKVATAWPEVLGFGAEVSVDSPRVARVENMSNIWVMELRVPLGSSFVSYVSTIHRRFLFGVFAIANAAESKFDQNRISTNHVIVWGSWKFFQILTSYLHHGPFHKVIQVCASFSFSSTYQATADSFFLVNSSVLLLRRPMITQCITAAVLFGAGDIVAQQAVEGKGKNHDVMFPLWPPIFF